MMVFDIEKDPPIFVAAEKRNRNQGKKAIATISLLIIGIGMLFYTAGSSSCRYTIPGAFLLILALFFIFSLSSVDWSYHSLSEAQIEAAIKFCRNFPEINAYVKKVKTQGREIVIGELEAMEIFAEASRLAEKKRLLYGN